MMGNRDRPCILTAQGRGCEQGLAYGDTVVKFTACSIEAVPRPLVKALFEGGGEGRFVRKVLPLFASDDPEDPR